MSEPTLMKLSNCHHPILTLAACVGLALSADAELIPSSGTRVASFHMSGQATDSVTGEAAPDGKSHNEEGLDIAGPGADVPWTHFQVPSGAQASGTEAGVTLTINSNTTGVGGEAPGNFDPGDLRDRTLRLLGPGFTNDNGGIWVAGVHDGFVNWELSGLKANTTYDLIFYGGGSGRPCLITISGGNSSTDSEGDVNFTSVTSDGDGKISGTWHIKSLAF